MAWVACAAVLLAALMPSLSHALAADRVMNVMLAEICSASGAASADQGQTSPDQQAGHLQDCHYCQLQTDTPVLPAPLIVAGPAKLCPARPALFYQSPEPLFSWAASSPRGPPRLS
ncbi:DUF2946 family protein [Massilia sp. BJB1822]|uniref:DUF2946 family protein n=1 Tax=Massilia sp. BJB1822 TaxID=2744470 RepID=UPI0015935E4D|nr:DUF2946 family protein [Massilia sp. BJB1822]